MRERIKLEEMPSFGLWTVLAYVGKSQYLCRCKCGREVVVAGSNIRYGKSTSCGKCGQHAKWTLFPCDRCGKPVRVRPWHAAHMKRHYCNRDCLYAPARSLPPLTERQQEILTGSMLGDGFMGCYQATPYFSKTQSIDREEYILWLQEELRPYSFDKIEKRKGGKIEIGNYVGHSQESLVVKTRCTARFTEWHQKWYVDRIKVIPRDIILSPLALAIWYADDGCNEAYHRRVSLATDCFQQEEVEFLVDLLYKQFNLKSRIGFSNGYPRIYTATTSYLDFLDIVRPHLVWKCFDYKVSLDRYTKPAAKSGAGHHNAKFSDEVIRRTLELLQEGYTHRQVRDMTGVSLAQQQNYLNGRRQHPSSPPKQREVRQRRAQQKEKEGDDC